MCSPHDGVDQLECRWRQGKDLYAIASSAQTPATAQAWFLRLAGFARPDRPGDAGVPPASFVYQVFQDGTSAVIWRKWDPGAIALGADSERQPLVARILVGNAATLPSATALALCTLDWSTIAGPAPGQVRDGERLPVIRAAELAELADGAGNWLEAAARQTEGLDHLIAAALREPQVPLSVQLPEQEMAQPPGEGPQAPLLWGLLQTVRPLLAGADGPGLGMRGWTFSTYEPPLGNTDTRWLTDIVFRVQKPSRQAHSVRDEIMVRPRDGGPAAGTDLCAGIARLLMVAYRQYGGQELVSFLGTIAHEHPDMNGRLEYAYQRLAGVVEGDVSADENRTAAMVPTAPPQAGFPAPEARAAVEPDPRDAFDQEAMDFTGPAVFPDPGDPEQATWAEAMLPSAPAARPPAAPASARLRTDVDQASARPRAERGQARGTYPPPSAVGRPGADARRLSGSAGGDRRETGGSSRWGILRVLDQLSLGPDEAGFPNAVDILRRRRQPIPEPEDRVEARGLLPAHGWYLPVLTRYDPRCVDGVLATLFELTVTPDLHIQAVADDVARWAGDYEAPPAIIRALAVAASRHGGGCPALLHSALRPALSWRWLGEHGVRDDLTDATAPAGPRAPSRRRAPAEPDSFPIWQLFRAEPRNGVIASLLAWLCLLQVAVLAAVIVSNL